MPTYEYECTKCGHSFELFQKITDEPLNKCPNCKGKIKRLIGYGAGIIFSRQAPLIRGRDPVFDLTCWAGKGSGFYATDYPKKSKSDKEKRETNTCPKAKEGCNACQNIK